MDDRRDDFDAEKKNSLAGDKTRTMFFDKDLYKLENGPAAREAEEAEEARETGAAGQETAGGRTMMIKKHTGYPYYAENSAEDGGEVRYDPGDEPEPEIPDLPDFSGLRRSFETERDEVEGSLETAEAEEAEVAAGETKPEEVPVTRFGENTAYYYRPAGEEEDETEDGGGTGLGDGYDVNYREALGEEEEAAAGGPGSVDTSDIYFPVIHRKPRRRIKHAKLLIFLGVVCVVLGLFAFSMSSVFNIKDIEVEGNHYYSDQEVINIANAQTGGNIFRDAQKSEIHDRLVQDPYFTDAKVRRKLPHTLVIQVDERKQSAALLYGDQFIVIDSSGMVLRQTDVEPKVTLIQGLTLSRIDVGKKVQAEEKATLRMTLQLLTSASKGDFYFKKIRISKTFMTGYVTDTLEVKGTPAFVKETIDSGNLQKVVSNLLKQDIRHGTISVTGDDYISFSPAVD